MPTTRSPRRLTREARREQLVAAAFPVVANEGFTEFSLEDVAAGANVTRNLLYHYFPRGRPDVAVAVLELAGRQLTDDWVFDELPLPERVAANFARMSAHALAPSDAWRVYRRARTAAEPELDQIVGSFTEMVISSIALNHLGTPNPTPLVHLALTGFLAFAEAILDEARIRQSPAPAVMQLLADTLAATIRAATDG